MSRGDWPTTMGPATIDFRCIRSAKRMNEDAREQAASRKLRELIEQNDRKGPEIRALLKTKSAYETAVHLGVMKEAEVTGRRKPTVSQEEEDWDSLEL